MNKNYTQRSETKKKKKNTYIIKPVKIELPKNTPYTQFAQLPNIHPNLLKTLKNVIPFVSNPNRHIDIAEMEIKNIEEKANEIIKDWCGRLQTNWDILYPCQEQSAALGSLKGKHH